MRVTRKWLGHRVGVLYGGMSDEREVSLVTGRAMEHALSGIGYDVELIDVGRDLPQALVAKRIEVVMNGLHGRFGEDGAVQGLLDLMGIPYTGSGVAASAVAMNKHLSKLAFQAAGLPLASHVFVTRETKATLLAEPLPFPLPAVVKPNANGSSVGVTIVHEAAELVPAVEKALQADHAALIEAFFAGTEVSVSVLDGEALGVIQIEPADDFYDYRAKYLVESTKYTYPAPLPPAVYADLMDLGTRANAALGGRGVTRTDLIVAPNGDRIVLEINTLPGMTAHSLVPKTALGEGISFEELMERLLEGAACGE